jgi:hypothetical protein
MLNFLKEEMNACSKKTLRTVDFADFTSWLKTFPWKTPDYCSYLPIFGNTDYLHPG